MTREWRRDALIYAELGMGFYITQFVLLFAGFIGFPLFILRSEELFIRIITTMVSIFLSSPPLLLAWLTYDKIVKVLKENRDPSARWAKTLEWLGYFLGLFIAGLMLYIANKKLEYCRSTQAGKHATKFCI